MQPIPRRFLVNTVQYYELDESSRYDTFKVPVAINNVLINYTKSSSKTGSADLEATTKGTMYMDAINTNPFIFLKYGSKIVDENGQEYFVNAVNPVQAFTLHHYAVTLV